MRLLAVPLLCFARLLYAAGTAGDGEAVLDEVELSISDKIRSIAIDMWHMADDLRDDRHDKVVQIQGENIRKAIQKLIDDAEERDEKQQQSKANGDGAGMKDSKITEYDGRNAKVVHKNDQWSPRSAIDTHEDLVKPTVGSYEGIPERWHERLKAYFMSVAAEEAEAEIKCRTTTPKKKK